jgi:hypothetical protein
LPELNDLSADEIHEMKSGENSKVK